MAAPEEQSLLRHVATGVHGRMLVRPPRIGGGAGWLVGFHGYGQSAAVFLEPLTRTPGSAKWLVVSVQALHPFYAARGTEIVANWMTRQDRELAIADNIAYVDAVLDDLAGAFGPPRGLVLAGFSQGVAMAYRAGVLGRRPVDAIVVSGGDVPPELATLETRAWPRVIAATGSGDTAYPPAALERDMALLRTRRPDARALVFEGGHEWSDAMTAATAAVLAEVAAATSS